MPAPRKYPPELRDRAIRLVREAMKEDPSLSMNQAVIRIGQRVGVNPDTLRGWVKQARIDAGELDGTTSDDAARIKRVVVSTYQAVSGVTNAQMDELWNQTKGMYVPGQEVEPKHFPRQIAFNVIPQIGAFMEDGTAAGEWQMVTEVKKILDPAIRISATCVQVPVFVGDAEAVNVEFEDFLDEDEARDILRESPGILVIDKREDGGYITPVESVGDFATFVSRIRQDPTVENGLNLWVVSDNLRKGAALNAVQIAEILGRDELRKG